MNRLIKVCGALVSGMLIVSMIFSYDVKEAPKESVAFEPAVSVTDKISEIKKQVKPIVVTAEEPKNIQVEEAVTISEDELRLLALVTMAEAEGECEEGKRLVIDTILNRVESEHFPDTITDVIYQKNQFTSMWNGRVDRCRVDEDICRLIEEELQNKTDNDVIFFRTGHYSTYGVPMYQVGNHYFSSYD